MKTKEKIEAIDKKVEKATGNFPYNKNAAFIYLSGTVDDNRLLSRNISEGTVSTQAMLLAAAMNENSTWKEVVDLSLDMFKIMNQK